MAQTAIPGLDVNDPATERVARRMRVPGPSMPPMYGTPQGVALDPGAAEAARRFGTSPPQPSMRNPSVPPGGFSSEAQAFREPPNMGPQRPAVPAAPPPTVGERIRGAGAATGQGVKAAGQATGEALKSAGRSLAQDVMRGGMRSTGIVSGVGETAGHGNAYFDDNVPLGDKLRIGATDLVSTAGSTLGAVGGGLFGAGAGSVVPVAGTAAGGVAGGVAGGYAGHKAGRALGNALFGGDDALTRNGYDPSRNIIDVGKSALSGESGDKMFGESAAAQQAQANGAYRGMRADTPTTLPAPSVSPPNTQGQPGGTVPGTGVPMPANPAGTIRRVGNSYSADGPIRFGADIDNPRNPGAGVTSLDFSEGRRQDQMELARMRERPQSVTTGDGGSTLGQGPIGFGGGTLVEANRAAHFSTPSASILSPGTGSMKPRDIRHANALANERSIAADRMANERGLATMREGGDMARANLGANVQRENNAAQRDVTMRGQDITREGHYLTVAQAQAAAQRAQTNLDREHQRNVTNDDFSQQSTAQADHNKWVESMFTAKDGDGKSVVDSQKVGDFNNSLQETVGGLVAQLRQSGDPAAIAKADKLARRGLAGLDAEDRALMKTLYDRRDRHMQTRGGSPLAGSGPVSNNLLDYALTGRTPGLVQNTVQMRGGQSIPENDLRYTTPANAILPDWFKTPTTALGPTPQEQRRMREGSR